MDPRSAAHHFRLRCIGGTQRSFPLDANDALQIFDAIQSVTIRPIVAETAVANAPQYTSTTTTGQVRKSDSEVSSNVA